MAAPEISAYEMKSFIAWVESIATSSRKEIMVTSPSLSGDLLLIARGGKDKQWMVTVVPTSDVEGWGKEEE